MLMRFHEMACCTDVCHKMVYPVFYTNRLLGKQDGNHNEFSSDQRNVNASSLARKVFGDDKYRSSELERV